MTVFIGVASTRQNSYRQTEVVVTADSGQKMILGPQDSSAVPVDRKAVALGKEGKKVKVMMRNGSVTKFDEIR